MANPCPTVTQVSKCCRLRCALGFMVLGLTSCQPILTPTAPSSPVPRTVTPSGELPHIPVLGFHNIVDLDGRDANSLVAKNSRESYPKQGMAAFMEYLATHDYWLLSTQDLYDYFLSESPQPIPEQYQGQKPIVISFDDGYTGTHIHMLEILQDIEQRHQKKLKVVMFVNPGVLGVPGAEFDHATCAELNVGLAQGYYDLQSHGLTHRDLTQVSPEELDQELRESQKILQDCTQALDPNSQVAAHISYPFGAINAAAQPQVAQYYRSGFLYNTKVLNPQTLDNPYLIPRLPVNKLMSVERLKQMAAGQ